MCTLCPEPINGRQICHNTTFARLIKKKESLKDELQEKIRKYVPFLKDNATVEALVKKNIRSASL